MNTPGIPNATGVSPVDPSVRTMILRDGIVPNIGMNQPPYGQAVSGSHVKPVTTSATRGIAFHTPVELTQRRKCLPVTHRKLYNWGGSHDASRFLYKTSKLPIASSKVSEFSTSNFS